MAFKEIKDKEIIEFYWGLHLSGKSLYTTNRQLDVIVLDDKTIHGLGVCWEIPLNEADYATFPELENAANLILFEENDKVRCVAERFE